MNIAGHDIGVCSWSLQPKNLAELAVQIRQLGLSHVQLGLAGLLELDETARQQELDQLRRAEIAIMATMMSFPGEDYATIASIRETGGFLADSSWNQRRELMVGAAHLTRQLGVKLVTVHVGFVPPSNHEKYAVILKRIRELANMLNDNGMGLTMETGQEPAHELLKFLNDLAVRNVHVNFDPANMILYGAGDPIEAIETLGRHIRHVHVKDAALSPQPGVKWGEEVPFGTGQVGARRFLNALHNVGFRGPLAIEREAGTARLADVGMAIQNLRAAAE
jgi:sugar phosphate isomerase/epimerase